MVGANVAGFAPNWVGGAGDLPVAAELAGLAAGAIDFVADETGAGDFALIGVCGAAALPVPVRPGLVASGTDFVADDDAATGRGVTVGLDAAVGAFTADGALGFKPLSPEIGFAAMGAGFVAGAFATFVGAVREPANG